MCSTPWLVCPLSRGSCLFTNMPTKRERRNDEIAIHMGLSPQAAASIATTLVAIGVAYYYLLRKNEPPARDRPPTAPSPPTTSETSTDLASTQEVDQQPQSSVVWRAVRAASRWSIGGTAIGAYEEFSPTIAKKTSSPVQ